MNGPPPPRKPGGTDSSIETNEAVEGVTHTDSIERVLGLDDVFEALAHSHRRYLLYTLSNTGEETLSELAANVAAWETDQPVSNVSETERTNVQISLYHTHIPKLAELNILAYQEGDDVIVRAQNTEQVMAVLHGAGAELDSRQESHATDHNGQ